MKRKRKLTKGLTLFKLTNFLLKSLKERTKLTMLVYSYFKLLLFKIKNNSFIYQLFKIVAQVVA